MPSGHKKAQPILVGPFLIERSKFESFYALRLNFFAAHLQMPFESAGQRLHGGDLSGKWPTDLIAKMGDASFADCLIADTLLRGDADVTPPLTLMPPNQESSGLSGAMSSFAACISAWFATVLTSSVSLGWLPDVACCVDGR